MIIFFFEEERMTSLKRLFTRDVFFVSTTQSHEEHLHKCEDFSFYMDGCNERHFITR